MYRYRACRQEGAKHRCETNDLDTLLTALSVDGAHRNPVLLDRSVWAGVAAAALGDTGARPWLRAHPDLVTAVPCEGTGSPYDIDTPDDLRSVQSA